MADTVRTAFYFKLEVPDKPGESARALGLLRDAGINLLAFTGFPRRRRAQLDFVVADVEAFKAAAKKSALQVRGPKTCFLAEGDDRPGAVADVLQKLADAKINVTAIDAVSVSPGRYGALFWVNARNVKKAAKALGIG